MLLFLKAIVPDPRNGELLAVPVNVHGHVRAGTYVAPYSAYRRKRSGDLVQGHRVKFPDEAHAHLYSVGRRLLGDEPVLHSEIDALWHNFRGYAENDPGIGRPFHRREHVADLARDYADAVHELTRRRPDGGRVEPGSVLDPDRAAEYWQRAARHWQRAAEQRP